MRVIGVEMVVCGIYMVVGECFMVDGIRVVVVCEVCCLDGDIAFIVRSIYPTSAPLVLFIDVYSMV